MLSPTVKSRQDRPRGLRPRPASTTRKSQLRRVALEGLEARTLMAVLPPAIHDPNVPNPVIVSPTGGNQSTAAVAVNPANPQRVATAWVRTAPNVNGPTGPPPLIEVEAAVSPNGGASWTRLSLPFNLADPTTSNPVQPYSQVT